MPYDPIRDSSSSSKLSPTTPNGTVYTNPLESPSTSFRPLSSGSGGGGPLATPGGSTQASFGGSSSGEGSLWSPAGTGGGAGLGGDTGAERRGAPPPPTKRLSLSMLLNDNQKDDKEDALVDMEAAGRQASTPRSSSFPILQPSSAPPTSYRTSPSGHQLPLPSSSSYPPPPAFQGPRRTSHTSTTSYESQPVHSPSFAPPGFTDAHAMPASNDTSFVMDAVNPAIKRKRDSLTVDGAAGARRKSSTSSVASRTSSGRNSSISAEAGGSSSTSSEPKRSAGSVRKGSDSSSTTSAVSSSSLPLPPPPPHQLVPSSSLRSTIVPTASVSPSAPPASVSPRSRQPTPTPLLPSSSSLPQPPSHLPPRPAVISPTTATFPAPPPHRRTNSNLGSTANVSSTSTPPPQTMPPPPSPLDPFAPKRTAYAPRNRTSAPRSVLVPLPREEYTRLRAHPEEGSQNPMRGKGPSKPKQLPSNGASSSNGTNGSYNPPPSSSGPSRPSSSAGSVAVVGGGGGGGGGARDEGEGESSGGLVSPTRVPEKRSGEFDDGSGDRRRRIDGAGAYVNADVAKVAEHYNARPEVGRENRHLSPIIGLKNFNNWVKSVLIGKFTRPGPPPDRRSPPQGVVLDLGCGKGGDLLKWNIARVQHYMGFDIAEVSVSQASERARALRNPTFSFEFYQLDCFAEPITKIIPEQRLLQYPIDVVTMQFCMHYAFETEEKARMMLDNVSRYLRPGGTFVGTIPNAEKLIENLQAIPEDAERLAFGNEVYEISFDDRENFPIYGHRYSFFLNDAVEDVPEYLVHWDNFEALAGEYGLQLIYRREFHDVFEEERETSEYGPLLKRMKVMNEQGESEMTEDQFAAANLYLAFAFQKQ